MFQPKIQLKLPTRLHLQHFITPLELLLDQSTNLPKCSNPAKLSSKLACISSQEKQIYHPSFVLNFLLIKINSWLTYSSFQSHSFISYLQKFYNSLLCEPKHRFHVSRNDGELMSQVLLESGSFEYVQEQDLEQILQGNALIGSTVVEACLKSEKLLQKCYVNVVLGSVSLYGRTDPYISIVHIEKNHWGQIEFARRINELIHLRPQKITMKVQIIQDAYSLRCSPQVHGISLQCLGLLKDRIDALTSKPQTRSIAVNSKKIRNLALRCQSEILLLDNLIFALNQTGHMSFLRTQRILNKHLTKNNIANSSHYDYMMVMLKKASYLVCQNKLLAVPSNTDTILLNNYQHDIYVNDSSSYKRFEQMLDNLRKIFCLELMGAMEVISSLFGKESVFKSKQMQSRYEYLHELRREDSMEYSRLMQRWLLI